MPIEQSITYDFDKLLAQYPGLFKGLLAYADDLRQYGTLKQAIEEAQKRLSTARAADEEFQAELAGRHAALEQDYAAKDRLMAEARVVHENTLAQQKIEASNIANDLIKQAKETAETLVAAGAVARAAVDKRVSEAQVQAVSLEMAIANNQQVLADLDKAVKARQKDLDKIEAARQALVAKIAS